MAEGNRVRAPLTALPAAALLSLCAVVAAGIAPARVEAAARGEEPLAVVPAEGEGDRLAQQAPLSAYRRTIQAYRAGATSRAVADLLALTRAGIEESLGPLERISGERLPDDLTASTGWALQEIEAAALLHIETAGRLNGVPADFDWHLTAAIRLLRLEAARRERDTPVFVVPERFRRDGLLAVAWQLQSLRAVDTLARCLTLIEADFPGDAEVLLAKGSAFEAQAWALLPSQGAGLGGMPPRGAAAIGAVLYGPRRDLLREAESSLGRALAIDASLGEARLRLGRVVGLQGRHAEALDLLGPLLEGARDRWAGYLARMFAGASAEGLRRFDEAAGHYASAARMAPRSQPARVALSHALRMNKDRQAALESALEVASIVPDEADEPWWEYHFGQLRLLAGRLERLLDEARR